jgi:hypothetical protein
MVAVDLVSRSTKSVSRDTPMQTPNLPICSATMLHFVVAPAEGPRR